MAFLVRGGDFGEEERDRVLPCPPLAVFHESTDQPKPFEVWMDAHRLKNRHIFLFPIDNRQGG